MDREMDSIHHNYNKCFADTSRLLAGGKSEVHNVDKDIKSACLDVLARLRVWGDESKAELPAVTRGSLDDVLKNESRMRGVVLRNLSRVQNNIVKCAEGVPDVKDENDDSDTSTDDEINNDTGLRKLHPCVRQLNQAMALLMQISLLIRQPGYERKYLRQSEKSGVISSQTFDKEFFMSETGFFEPAEDNSNKGKALREDEFVSTSPQPQVGNSNKRKDLELPQRVDQNLVNVSGYGGSSADLTRRNRQKKSLYRINDEVQMDVIEHSHHGQEVRVAKRFFVHNRQYITASNKWVYQLNEEENGQAGAPWEQHRWFAERPLSPVL